MEELEIGSYRLLLKEKKLFSIGIQQTVFFDKDIIIEVTSETGSSSYFGKMKILLPGLIPTLIDNIHGNVTFDLNDTISYSLPDFTLIKN